MAADYPVNPFTFNPQSTADDFAGDATDALGGDHNDIGEEVEAHGVDLRAAAAVEGAADMAAVVTAIAGVQTDGRIPLVANSTPLVNKTLFNESDDFLGWTVMRFSGPGSETIKQSPAPVFRETSSKGIRLKAFEIRWSIDTADITTDVTITPAELTMGADTVAPTVALLAGTYDTAHDTPIKRRAHGGGGTQRFHTAVFTLTTPIFWEDTKQYLVFFNVDDSAGGSATLDYYGGFVLVDRAFNDVG